MTQQELEDEAGKQCSLCKAGMKVRFRPDSKEFVHDYGAKPFFSHTICGANELRKSNVNT